MTTTDDLKHRVDALRALSEVEQENMLKAARMSYDDARQEQVDCMAKDSEYMDALRLLREQITNNRSRLSDANFAMNSNLEILIILESEKTSRMSRRAAAE